MLLLIDITMPGIPPDSHMGEADSCPGHVLLPGMGGHLPHSQPPEPGRNPELASLLQAL